MLHHPITPELAATRMADVRAAAERERLARGLRASRRARTAERRSRQGGGHADRARPDASL